MVDTDDDSSKESRMEDEVTIVQVVSDNEHPKNKKKTQKEPRNDRGVIRTRRVAKKSAPGFARKREAILSLALLKKLCNEYRDNLEAAKEMVARSEDSTLGTKQLKEYYVLALHFVMDHYLKEKYSRKEIARLRDQFCSHGKKLEPEDFVELVFRHRILYCADDIVWNVKRVPVDRRLLHEENVDQYELERYPVFRGTLMDVVDEGELREEEDTVCHGTPIFKAMFYLHLEALVAILHQVRAEGGLPFLPKDELDSDGEMDKKPKGYKKRKNG